MSLHIMKSNLIIINVTNLNDSVPSCDLRGPSNDLLSFANYIDKIDNK